MSQAHFIDNQWKLTETFLKEKTCKSLATPNPTTWYFHTERHREDTRPWVPPLAFVLDPWFLQSIPILLEFCDVKKTMTGYHFPSISLCLKFCSKYPALDIAPWAKRPRTTYKAPVPSSGSYKQSTVVHGCHPSMREGHRGMSWGVLGQPGLHESFSERNK